MTATLFTGLSGSRLTGLTGSRRLGARLRIGFFRALRANHHAPNADAGPQRLRRQLPLAGRHLDHLRLTTTAAAG